MNVYEDLIESGRLRKQKVSRDEILRALERADRDLRTARKIMAEDWDWGFAVSYNAVLQAARAYMFFKGYRSAGMEAHKTTFSFLLESMGNQYEDMVTFFDRARNKRNQVIYDVAGLITETEARNLFSKATEFVNLIRTRIERKGSS